MLEYFNTWGNTMKTKLSNLFRLLRNNKSSEISSLQKIEVEDENILKYTSRVSIELSNLCNYAEIHKKCPLNLVTEPTILPAKIQAQNNTLQESNLQSSLKTENPYCLSSRPHHRNLPPVGRIGRGLEWLPHLPRFFDASRPEILMLDSGCPKSPAMK